MTHWTNTQSSGIIRVRGEVRPEYCHPKGSVPKGPGLLFLNSRRSNGDARAHHAARGHRATVTQIRQCGLGRVVQAPVFQTGYRGSIPFARSQIRRVEQLGSSSRSYREGHEFKSHPCNHMTGGHMRARHRNARDTRWLYRLEEETLRFNSFANADRSMKFLRDLADKVWAAEAPAGRRKPTITADYGVLHQGRAFSYCEGFTKIVLARSQRNVLVLLHELTHALGPCVHGKKFIKLYFGLLRRWAGYHRWFLQTVAAERGIVL